MEKFFNTLVQISLRFGWMELEDEEPPSPPPPTPRLIKTARRRVKPHQENIIQVNQQQQQEPETQEQEADIYERCGLYLSQSSEEEFPQPQIPAGKKSRKNKNKNKKKNKKQRAKKNLPSMDMLPDWDKMKEYHGVPNTREVKVDKYPDNINLENNEFYVQCKNKISGPYDEIPTAEKYDFPPSERYYVIRRVGQFSNGQYIHIEVSTFDT